MSHELYAGSPLGPLSDALTERTPAGGVGLIIAPAGLGKTALLVHLGLQSLLQGASVLHVTLNDTVDHARAHYDEVFRAIGARGRQLADGRDCTEAQVGAERHRMIHGFAGKPFDADQVRRHLDLLKEAAQFDPELILVDGFALPDVARHLTSLAEIARAVGAFTWVAVRTAEPVPVEILERCGAVIRMRPDGPLVEVSLDGTALVFHADPSSLLRADDDAVAEQMAGTSRPEQVTLYHGGASGAESAFGDAAARYGLTEVAFTFEGHHQSREEGAYVLSPAELAAGDVSLQYVSKRLHRTYNDQGGLIRGVLQTLWHMVSRSQQVFVVGVIQPDGTVKGGTGWSVELARTWSRDLWVFDQERNGWHRWDGSAWVLGMPVIRSLHITGTGTRYLKAAGREAIDALFERSFEGEV